MARTAVNMAINVIQITRADRLLACMAIGYRVQSSQEGPWPAICPTAPPVNYQVDQVTSTDDKGKPVQDTWADNSPKTDDKGQPVYKQQDKQVAKDDLDKAKNTDAAVLGA